MQLGTKRAAAVASILANSELGSFIGHCEQSHVNWHGSASFKSRLSECTNPTFAYNSLPT